MTRPLARCRGCHAAIVWVTMRETGKAMPCDPEVLTEWIRETDGKAVSTRTLITEDGVAITGRRGTAIEPGTREVVGRVPHWSMCPTSHEFRRPTGARRG